MQRTGKWIENGGKEGGGLVDVLTGGGFLEKSSRGLKVSIEMVCLMSFTGETIG